MSLKTQEIAQRFSIIYVKYIHFNNAGIQLKIDTLLYKLKTRTMFLCFVLFKTGSCYVALDGPWAHYPPILKLLSIGITCTSTLSLFIFKTGPYCVSQVNFWLPTQRILPPNSWSSASRLLRLQVYTTMYNSLRVLDVVSVSRLLYFYWFKSKSSEVLS